MANNDQPNQQANTFYLFPQLPCELRLLIWEHTWPDTRIIRATDIRHEQGGILSLHMGGWMFPSLQGSCLNRSIVVFPRLPDSCHFPVALQVCHESRQHMLSEYRLVQNNSMGYRSFYFSPERDVLCLDGIIRSADRYGDGDVDAYHYIDPLPPAEYFCGLTLGSFKTLYTSYETRRDGKSRGRVICCVASLESLETVIVGLCPRVHTGPGYSRPPTDNDGEDGNDTRVRRTQTADPKWDNKIFHEKAKEARIKWGKYMKAHNREMRILCIDCHDTNY